MNWLNLRAYIHFIIGHGGRKLCVVHFNLPIVCYHGRLGIIRWAKKASRPTRSGYVLATDHRTLTAAHAC
jgi:hypothetical protein